MPIKPRLVTVSIVMAAGLATFAQQPSVTNQGGQQTSSSARARAQTVEANYEGGFPGYPHIIKGTVTLEDLTDRLVFRDKKWREIFSIPCSAIIGAYRQTNSTRSRDPMIEGPSAYLRPDYYIKIKRRYLVLQFTDPDNDTSAATSFRLDGNKEVEATLLLLAEKAGLTPRGDGFIKKNKQR